MNLQNFKSKWPLRISRYLIPIEVVSTSQVYLRRLGAEHLEGIAYWTGIIKRNEAIIRSAIFPGEYANNPKNSWGFSHVDLDTAFKVGNEIHKRNEYLFIQLHTHPFEAFHSYTDNNYPISHRIGFISIVIPYFAKNPMKNRNTWKVYEYKGKGKWRGLGQHEIMKRFIIMVSSDEQGDQ